MFSNILFYILGAASATIYLTYNPDTMMWLYYEVFKVVPIG